MSLEIAVIGGLIGAAFSIFFLISFMDKEAFGYLRTIMMFLGLSFILFALSSMASFLSIAALTAGLSPAQVTAYTNLSNYIILAYQIYLIVFIIVFFWVNAVFIYNVLSELWVRFFEKEKDTRTDVLR